MSNLLSNTAFGQSLRTRKYESISKIIDLRNNYDDFLSKTTEVWMFVPCKYIDGIWVVLSEPVIDNYLKSCQGTFFDDLAEYVQAKEKCFFEGFEFIPADDDYPIDLILTSEKGLSFSIEQLKDMTIEDLVKADITLTEKLRSYLFD